LWLSIDEIQKIHGGDIAFHHHGFFDEYVVIAAYKDDMKQKKFPVTTYYFCDEKTATIMSETLVKAAAWATYMTSAENDMEVGLVSSEDLIESVEHRS
jgi:hypothetical protein